MEMDGCMDICIVVMDAKICVFISQWSNGCPNPPPYNLFHGQGAQSFPSWCCSCDFSLLLHIAMILFSSIPLSFGGDCSLKWLNFHKGTLRWCLVMHHGLALHLLISLRTAGWHWHPIEGLLGKITNGVLEGKMEHCQVLIPSSQFDVTGVQTSKHRDVKIWWVSKWIYGGDQLGRLVGEMPISMCF